MHVTICITIDIMVPEKNEIFTLICRNALYIESNDLNFSLQERGIIQISNNIFFVS